MKSGPLLTIATAAAAATAFAGCSNSPSVNSALPASPASRAPLQRFNAAGNDLRFVTTPRNRLIRALSATPEKKSKVEKDFFVSSLLSDVLIYSDKTYTEIGEITNGLTAADGVWVDSKGNVYVANVSNDVVEYAKGAGSPSCTYTGASDPINVTTDSKGNVYVVDFGSGAVDEYAQCSNTIEKKWTANGAEGAAVDKAGDLFVSFGGEFEEFVGGSSNGTLLGATVGSSAGLVLDKKGDLIADDQGGSIDVIAPPYKTAVVLVSGLSDPFHCSLNKKENLLFNSNEGTGDVTVYSYPSGKLLQTVDGGGEGVGESPNAVF